MAPIKRKSTAKKSTARKSTAKKAPGCAKSNVHAFETGYKAGKRHGRQGH
jgi:hypothetical protein